MREFKNRTIALILASAVTVAGSFAAEKYSNTLMGVNFETSTNGNISIIVETKNAYTGNLTPVKKDSNTYVLMLPNINSSASTPDLKNVASNIESVNIRTMPYTQNNNGYTRITVKTFSPINLLGKNKVFIPDPNKQTHLIENQSTSSKANTDDSSIENQYIDEFSTLSTSTSSVKPAQHSNIIEETTNSYSEEKENNYEENEALYSDDFELEEGNTNKTFESFILFWGIILIITCCAFFYVKAKNRLTEIAGERLDIDVDDNNEKKENKNKKIKKIKETVKTLDKTYSKSAISSYYNYQPVNSNMIKPVATTDIVDMDELFEQERIKTKNSVEEKEEEENIALEEFLSGFSFLEEIVAAEEEPLFDEETYNKIFKNNINFSVDDIKCMKNLLSTEINEATFKDIEKYLVSNPIKKEISKELQLETFVLEYAITQNIYFKEEDMIILRDLLNVEFDKNFIRDLRTRPERTLQMQKEMEAFEKELKKPSKSVTLKVKDLLPDLSEEFKKLGSKRVESNYKPEAVYYQAGYDVSVLSISDELPDLSKAYDANDTKETNSNLILNLLDDNYEVAKLKVPNLPNLEEAVSNKNSQNNIKKDLMKKIAETKTEKDFQQTKPTQNTALKQQKIKYHQEIKKSVQGNESFNIITSVDLINNMGCHLAKNDNGYALLKYKGDTVSKIKDLASIKSEKLQARLSEKLTDGTLRYIIKIDSTKLIVDIKDDDINYVMDL